MRIFDKLIIAFLAFIIIPVMFVSYVVFYNSKKAIEQQIVSKLIIIINEEVSKIETSLNEKMGDVEILGHFTANDTTMPTLSRFIGDWYNPAYIKAKDEMDRKIVLFEHTQSYIDIMLTNTEGKIVYTLNPGHGLELGTTVPNKDAIFQKIKSGVYLGEIYQVSHQKEGVYSQYIAGPAYGAANELLGLVILELDIGKMYQSMKNDHGMGGSWEVLLVKRTPNNRIAFISPLKKGGGIDFIRTIPFGSDLSTPAQRALLGETGSGFGIDYQGQEVLAAWRPIPTAGWGLVVKVDKAEAYLPIEKLGKLLIAIVLFTLFSAVAAAYAMARSISKPILNLKKGAETISSGNLDFKVGTDAKDEVGELSREFDAMTHYLKKTTTSIHLLNEGITARKQAESKFKNIFESSRDAIMTLAPPTWHFTSGNPATVKMFNAKDEVDFISHGPWEVSPSLQPDGRSSAEKAREMIETAMREGSHQFEWMHQKIGGDTFMANVLLTRMGQEEGEILQATVRDITEHKQAETYREMGMEILKILNAPGDLHEAIQNTLTEIKTRMGFDAIGIRLQSGEDYPYFGQEGFSENFLKTENTLLARNPDGGICRDKDGKPCLECTCGLVVAGKTDPSNPHFTPGGSCWVNDSLPLFPLNPDKDPRFHPRNRCIREGYASVALVPIRSKDKIVGLIQLNDKRKDQFTIGMIEAIEGIASHIGEAIVRKQIEQELRTAKELTDAIVENVPLMIFMKEAKDLRFVVLNHAGEEILGYDRKELMGKSDLDFFPAEQANFFIAKDREVLKDGAGSIDIPEESITTALHAQRWLHTRKVAIRGHDGTASHLLGISEDITEHKLAEEHLALLNQRHNLILNSLEEGIMELSLQGNHAFVNAAAAKMLGYTTEELLGSPSHSTWHHTKTDGSPYPREECKIYAAFREGTTHHVSDEVFWRKDGTCFPVEYTSAPIYERGEVVGAVVTFVDITDRKRAIAEKTKLEDQLRVSQKLEAIGLLTGGIAHDFNNLLGVITGFCELSLLDIEDGNPIKENLEEIQGATERAAALTHQLLAFSRSQVLELKVLNLNTIFDNMDRIISRLIGENIHLSVKLNPDLGKIKADTSQMEQVILNIILNARDAMPKGGKLGLETHNVTLDDEYAARHPGVKPGQYVLMMVTDTGRGMDEETVSRAFEPFFTTKERGKGTGLGLSTVYGIVKQIGGHISVYSELGRGTTCNVYLPLVDEQLKIEAHQDDSTVQLRGSETILVVEDEDKLRKLVCRILRDKGYTILEAASGEEGLRISKAHKEPIPLLLTDVIMPGMNGRKMAEKIMAHRPETKVIYMSGYTENVIFHSGVLEEGINLLQKPFTSDALTHRVRKVLDSGGSNNE